MLISGERGKPEKQGRESTTITLLTYDTEPGETRIAGNGLNYLPLFSSNFLLPVSCSETYFAYLSLNKQSSIYHFCLTLFFFQFPYFFNLSSSQAFCQEVPLCKRGTIFCSWASSISWHTHTLDLQDASQTWTEVWISPTVDHRHTIPFNLFS